MRGSTVAFPLALLLTASSVSAENTHENATPGGVPSSEDEQGAGLATTRVERQRIRAGAGLLVLPSLGPALELGVCVAGGLWVESAGWLAPGRLGDDHAPPAMGVGPRLSYRALSTSWELRGSLAAPVLQHDREYVDTKGTSVDEVRDYLVPSIAPGLGAGFRMGPLSLVLDAELILAATEYFDYSIFVEEKGGPGLVSRGTSLTAFPRVALMASYAY